MIFAKTGANLMSMMNSLSGNGGVNIFNNTNKEESLKEKINVGFKTSETESTFIPKKKMKGPSVDMNEFVFIKDSEDTDKIKKELSRHLSSDSIGLLEFGEEKVDLEELFKQMIN
jgi:hypothetical protein